MMMSYEVKCWILRKQAIHYCADLAILKPKHKRQVQIWWRVDGFKFFLYGDEIKSALSPSRQIVFVA